jgi:hypothetical protein
LGCGSGGGVSEVSQLPPRFIVEVDQLPAMLARPGVVLLAAKSKAAAPVETRSEAERERGYT